MGSAQIVAHERGFGHMRDDGISSRSFFGTNGEAEHFITVQPAAAQPLGEQIDCLERRYARARRLLGLAPETAVFRRIFVSDVLNQCSAVGESALAGTRLEGPVAISMVQQPPLPGAKVALLAYHVDGRRQITKRRLSANHIIVEKNGLRHLWSTGLCAGVDDGRKSEALQTRHVFEDLIEMLATQVGTLRDNCVRTWIYLKDVDVFYQGMVDSRRELFTEHGMTKDTHYIASTGIEGACAHRFDVVAMDAYSILGLVPQQVSYLNDFDRLCATQAYNVTFERGTRIAYSDRAHLFISGTASIDRSGRILYPGDVLGQLDHALGNVEALLTSGSAGLADNMMYLVVYLRDAADFACVDRYLSTRLPDVPTMMVQGAVCRPGWLVEVEGVALAANDAPGLPSF